VKLTNAMLFAAVKQAVKEGILPKYAPMKIHEEHYEAMERIIEAALSKEDEEL